jgi:hypothetical protein
MDGSVCKHIIAFSRLMQPVTKEIAKEETAHLMHVCGWTGKELHPEIELGGPGAVVQEDTTPTPKDSIPPDPDLGVNDPLPEPEKLSKVTVKCQYCKMSTTRDQKAADAWLKKHEALCLKNPINKQLITPCRYCGKDITERSPEDLVLAIEDHEATCPKNPANILESSDDTPEPEIPVIAHGARPEKEESTALSTGNEFPDENERVRRHVENRGGFYKNPRGEEVPDSAAMSLYALDTCRISTETILIEKNADQAKAVVRGYKGGVYVDASVILRFDVLKRRELLKMAKKYPKAIINWTEELVPILDLNFILKDKTPVVTLGEHMFNFAIDQEQFAERTAETLARRRAFDMLTGVDWRDDVEVQVEDADAAAIGSKKR